ncbi:MAG: histidine kinase [Desulfobacterales bacterium]|nr:histidine kinase [Desulfobacterales bacterium]
MGSKKELGKSMAITAVFNTVIAGVLTYTVIREERYWDVFVVSQFTGLSICFFVNKGIRLSEKRLRRWMGAFIVGGIGTGVMVGAGLGWGYLSFNYGIDVPYYYRNVFSDIAVFGFIFGIPITYFFFTREKLLDSEKKIQNGKIKRLTMEKEAAMTTLRLLQAQIEPHFLFNTLSNVIMLMDMDADKAKKMLIDVNEYLRISLDRTRQEMVTLAQELNLVRRYLDIFKVRMGKRLSYTIDDRTGLPEFRFPPLVIQPLVENAIQYGLEPKVEGGRIIVACRAENDEVVIEISDTGVGLDENADRAGIGIDNVSRRLSGIYGSRAGLTLTPNRPQGLKAVIKVPK